MSFWWASNVVLRNSGTPFVAEFIIGILLYLIITNTLFLLIKILSQTNIKYGLFKTVASTASGHKEETPHAARTLRPLQFQG